ncbi:hypothetical protein F5B19DRAFT_202475 [Rostrohypoxylon terebratum]|nr:hypothetical protein F5B19DRAFT_202475 [Rostrohypoxylon terebratum]
MSSTARRAHHKSRGGCTACKSKKIKCDEEQPCSYCVKKQISCSLVPPRSPPSIAAGSGSGSGRGSRTSEIRAVQPFDEPFFSFNDFRLYQHFVVSTAIAQADDSASIAVWRDVVVDLATRHRYLLHEILAIAALHLRSIVSEQADYLERVAAEHQAKAIPLFRQALTSISAETALPLFACSCLFIPYHFAAAKNASSLLFNEEAGSLAEWLMLIQGCAAITVEQRAVLMRSPLRALLGNLYTPQVEELSSGSSDASLVDMESKLPVTPEYRGTYAMIVLKLRVSFYLSDKADSVVDRKNAALRFPPLLNQYFRADLAAKHPAALIVMAYWCVLLHRVEDRWWLRDRVKPLLVKIQELISAQYRILIEWPLEETGIICLVQT